MLSGTWTMSGKNIFRIASSKIVVRSAAFGRSPGGWPLAPPGWFLSTWQPANAAIKTHVFQSSADGSQETMVARQTRMISSQY